MKQVLVFGAGKSATYLIDYLLKLAENLECRIVIADANIELAKQKIGNSKHGTALAIDINDIPRRQEEIARSTIVVSMLPPALHLGIAKDCIEFSKHFLTASYVDASMQALEQDVKTKNLIFLCEMGLDPGIDHMSAMHLIRSINLKGGKITSFKSHCGGLIAPESDDNPMHYKISWNPKNIILAGKSGAHFRKNGQEVAITYQELFAESRLVKVTGLSELAWYPNRDSLSYASVYGLTDTPTFIRTTLRYPAFINAWQAVIELKLTDEAPIPGSKGLSVAELFASHIHRHGLIDKYQKLLDGPAAMQLKWLDLENSTIKIEADNCSAADFLQAVAEIKMLLLPRDRDMIVMLHQFEWEKNQQKFITESSLIVKGEDAVHTAMAKTVGLPLGVAVKMILTGKWQFTGLHIPILEEIYDSVLPELEELGIKFHETESEFI